MFLVDIFDKETPMTFTLTPPENGIPMRCPACLLIKPRGEFKRKASLAQSRAWLKSSTATKRITYFGRTCNECAKQKQRARHKLTPAELEKALVNEGKNALYIKLAVEQRRAKGMRGKQKGALRGLKTQRAKPYAEHRKEISRVVELANKKLAYLRGFNAHEDGAVKWCSHALTLLLRARNKLRNDQAQAKVAPDDWRDLISAEFPELKKAYAALNGRMQERLKPICVGITQIKEVKP